MSITCTTLEGAIASLLLADPTVSSIVGTRVQPMSDPQSVPRPKLTYTRWGTDRSSDVGGFTNDGPTGLADAKLFIDAWSDDMLTAKQLATAVRHCLNGYTGVVGGITIHCIYIQDERETPAGLVPGTEKPVQRQTIDLRVSYSDQ